MKNGGIQKKKTRGGHVLSKVKTKFVCSECGYETSKWMGKCPTYIQWNTMVEEREVKGKDNKISPSFPYLPTLVDK